MILDNVSIPLDNHYKLQPDGSIEFRAICEEHQDVVLTVTCSDNGCVMVSQCPACRECETCMDISRESIRRRRYTRNGIGNFNKQQEK